MTSTPEGNEEDQKVLTATSWEATDEIKDEEKKVEAATDDIKDVEKQDPVLNEWDKAATDALVSATASGEAPKNLAATRKHQSEAWRNIDVIVKKTFAHRLFIGLVYLSVAIHSAMLCSQVIGVYFFWMTSVQGIMRCYVIAMCICGIFVELGFTKFIRESAILNVWITRGLFYALIGILAMEEMDTEAEGKHLDAPGRSELVFFIAVMAYVVTALGLLYYLMGCLCIQIHRNRVYKDFEKRCIEVKAAKKEVSEAPAL